MGPLCGLGQNASLTLKQLQLLLWGLIFLQLAWWICLSVKSSLKFFISFSMKLFPILSKEPILMEHREKSEVFVINGIPSFLRYSKCVGGPFSPGFRLPSSPLRGTWDTGDRGRWGGFLFNAPFILSFLIGSSETST